MLSEEKIKKMIRLSEYETGQGSMDLRRMRYMKMDYVRMHILKTVAAVFLAYLLILALLVLYNREYILQNALSLPIRGLVLWSATGFVLVCALSVFATCKIAIRDYDESHVRAKEYYVTLQELLELYEEEEKQEDTGL